MNTEMAMQTGLGLRHVIEDGIAILNGEEFAPQRKAYVLNDLQSLFGQVVRGSELVHSPSLFVGRDERRAYEAFSLLDRFLPSNDNSLQETLKASVNTLTEITNGKNVASDKAQQLTNFLKVIVASLRRLDSAGLPNQPDAVSLLGN
jgi:hypothetical protein